MTFEADHKYISQKLDIGKEMLYLTRDEVISLGIREEDILKLVKEALIAHGKKEYEMPAKIGIHPYEEVFYHAMPAYVPSQKAAGMKWIECYPNNPTKFGLPQTTGLLILNDILTGCPIAVMDCTWITAMRTRLLQYWLQKHYMKMQKLLLCLDVGCKGQSMSNM